MFKNYLKIAFRHILYHKGQSLINITGLAIGMACCILIMFWVLHELSYDDFHENAGRLFRIAKNTESKGELNRYSLTPAPLGRYLKREYPEIVKASRLVIAGNRRISYGDKSFNNDILAFADSDFLDMFSFPLIQGNAASAFFDKYAVIISEDMSLKYFGDEDVIGKIIVIDRREYTVTGVLEDIPENSHLDFDCLANFDSRISWVNNTTDNWDVSAYYTYVMLENGADVANVNQKIAGAINRNRPDHDTQTNISLQPIRRIHLFHDVEDYLKEKGDIKYVYLFSGLASLILVIACLNFINLSTARSGIRAKEVGLRKVVGAKRSELIRQFLGESVILSLIALLIAIVLVELFLPSFQALIGKNLNTNWLSNPYLIIGFIGISLFVGIFAGIYPAYRLSSFKPVSILSGNLKSGKSKAGFRRVLVVIQFALTVFLLIGAGVIHNQLEFIRTKKLGFDKEHLVYFDMRGRFFENYENIRQELLQDPAILGIAAGAPPVETFDPAISISWDGMDARESEEEMIWHSLTVDENFIDLMGMEIIQGKGFEYGQSHGQNAYFILNETAAKLVDPESPVGRQLLFSAYKSEITPKKYQGTIVGVVKDFHFGSMHQMIEPLIIHMDRDVLYSMCARINPESWDKAKQHITRIWNKYASEYPLDIHFLDQTIDSFYRSEEKLGVLFKYCSFLAILVSCLGLFGLASFIVEQRTKEIGIRKVLGASVPGIIKLVSTEFFWLILLASLITWPIAYWAMTDWLMNFAYRTNVKWETFVFSAVIALAAAMSLVCIQTLKTALTNPIDVLRHE